MNYNNTRTAIFDTQNSKLMADTLALRKAPRSAVRVTSKRSAKKPRQVAKTCRIHALSMEKPGARIALMQNGQWKKFD